MSLQHVSAVGSRGKLRNRNSIIEYLILSGNCRHSAAPQAQQSGLGGLDFSRIQVPQAVGLPTPNRAPPLSVGMRDDPAMIRDMLLANPDQLALLQQNNPTLAEAVLSGSLGKLHQLAKQSQKLNSFLCR